MKLATKSRLRSLKESMVPGDSFRNHDLAGGPSDLSFLHKRPSWAGSLNFEEIRALNTLSVNGGSVCLIKVSTVTRAFVPMLMASSRASKSRIFCEVDLFRRTRCSAPTPPYSFGTDILENDLPEQLEWRDHSISGTGGAAGSGGLAAVRSCIRRPLFSFMILICSAMSCISWWRPSRSGIWPGLAIGYALLFGGLLALGLGSNQQSILLGLLDTGPRILKGRPAQTNKNKQPGRGRSKPLRRGDQTKAMTAGKRAQRRVVSWRRESRDGRIDRILVEIDQAKYSTSPKSEEETTLHLRSTDEYPDSGSGELSGDSLARFHAERWTRFTSVKRVRR
ncbi:hypothetical protein Acr_05g0012190 [Actinidia rufa]|uniref:Uncharacterized protein n=1 Tax=Actinidia rufa TaxID=165716 RepID=A0A7J0EMP7_9ERIC|nr:hypothetical protein Acr_05g0012190 [Actinidia rufa]